MAQRWIGTMTLKTQDCTTYCSSVTYTNIATGPDPGVWSNWSRDVGRMQLKQLGSAHILVTFWPCSTSSGLCMLQLNCGNGCGIIREILAVCTKPFTAPRSTAIAMSCTACWVCALDSSSSPSLSNIAVQKCLLTLTIILMVILVCCMKCIWAVFH